VGNAIKFTDTSEVRVIVNGRFNVSVTDTGPGIRKEHQARIFEQFRQVDSSNTKAKGGLVLGSSSPADRTAAAFGSSQLLAWARPSKWSSQLAPSLGSPPHDEAHLLVIVSAIALPWHK